MGKIFLYGRSQKKTKVDPYAKLTVNCPLGVTVCAISADTNTTLKAVSEKGVAVFNRLTEGYWDITFDNVEFSPSTRIKIDSLDYEITMAYAAATSYSLRSPRMTRNSSNVEIFSATINVTYPAGSICTCSDGATVLMASDCDGLYSFKIPNAGVWNILCGRTNDTVYQSVSETVEVTDNGQVIDIEMKYFSAIIHIVYPRGSTCTASIGDSVLTAPDISGEWNCDMPFAGTWTISCTDGKQSVSETIEINQHGDANNISLKYFAATIDVTYPEGSVCTCSDGKDVLIASDTSGHYAFTIPNPGEWTISSIADGAFDSEVVSITQDGQNVSSILSYPVDDIYDDIDDEQFESDMRLLAEYSSALSAIEAMIATADTYSTIEELPNNRKDAIVARIDDIITALNTLEVEPVEE